MQLLNSNLMKEYTINGNKFRNANGFYKYAESVFISNLSWETGRNLDAFTELLEGGFGEHDYKEEIIVEWINMNKSRERLTEHFYNSLVDILENTENVTFIKKEHR